MNFEHIHVIEPTFVGRYMGMYGKQTEDWTAVHSPFLISGEPNSMQTCRSASSDSGPILLKHPGYLSISLAFDGDVYATAGMNELRPCNLRFRFPGGGGGMSPATRLGLCFLSTAIALSQHCSSDTWEKWQVEIKREGSPRERAYLKALKGRPSPMFHRVINDQCSLSGGEIARLRDDTTGSQIGFLRLKFEQGMCWVSTEYPTLAQNYRGKYEKWIENWKVSHPNLNSWAIVYEPEWSRFPPLPERVVWMALHVLALGMVIDNKAGGI